MIYVACLCLKHCDRCNSFSRYHASMAYSERKKVERKSQKIDNLPVFATWQSSILVMLSTYRAVAAGPVSPVLTGPLCEGCGFRPISKLDRKACTICVRRNGQNGIHVRLCRLASEKHRIGQNWSQKFSWGSMPPDPPRV